MKEFCLFIPHSQGGPCWHEFQTEPKYIMKSVYGCESAWQAKVDHNKANAALKEAQTKGKKKATEIAQLKRDVLYTGINPLTNFGVSDSDDKQYVWFVADYADHYHEWLKTNPQYDGKKDTDWIPIMHKECRDYLKSK